MVRRGRPSSSSTGVPVERVEVWRGEEWAVRPVPGFSAAKVYRCPGCDHEIVAGVPHVVAWPVHDGFEGRRHWHTPCWRARDRRWRGA